VSLLTYAAQRQGRLIGPVHTFENAPAMVNFIRAELNGATPTVLIIGALGRVGTGGADLCEVLSLSITKWDMAETASGGPFPQVLDHDVFLNCILARDGTPVFVPASATTDLRKLSVIGDIACDPQSDFSPIKVYGSETTWDAPALRVHDDPPLDVMAIDNLPSLLPAESSDDFAGQMLAHLGTLDRIDAGVWGRAKQVFDDAV
jgi:saccharopine dehydrogenase (NAD+, L-lysine-forming)